MRLSTNHSPVSSPIKPSDFSVLIVDDDDLTRMHIQLALTKCGFNVTEARSGAEALIKASEHCFDSVLMDVRMPTMDGFETCLKFREQANNQNTPIIMVTGLDDVDSVERATDVGATDYVTKPINTPILAQRLKHIIDAHRNSVELDNERANQAAIMTALPETILNFDYQGSLIDCKFSSSTPSGLQNKATIGSHIAAIFDSETSSILDLAILNALNGNRPSLRLNWSEEKEYIFEANFVAQNNNEVTCILNDITKQEHQQRYIESLAITDGLTGLSNKKHFLQLSEQCLSSAPDNEITIFQLNFNSLPGIKNSVGSKVSDEIVVRIADRISSVLKQKGYSDYGSLKTQPILARTCDTEFHILYSYDINHPMCRALIKDITDEFNAPIHIDNYEFHIPFKSGGTSSSGKNADIESLMKMAGIAAQQASFSNMSENVIYTPGMEKDIQRKLILKAELHKALQSGELKTVYQPKVCAKTRKIKGVEALLRWEHPSLGFISPAEFIPLAEESGLILNIGEYVLEQACKQASKWKKAGGVNPTIAVNVSGHQFNQREIADKLFVLLDFYELSPSDIELEITESVILEQQIVIDILESIRARGIKIAIDDFGTGYSSLSMLKTFPVDILKIDRAFVKDISDSPEARNIADAIVALGHALNLTLVAEGIETEEQLNYFCDRKCHLIQGYLTGKPMSANEIQEQYLM